MSTYEVVARNFSEATENKIHSDEIARKYGFRGALVPGVAVFGHLTYPLVAQHGADWLSHSVSSLKLIKPAYDGERLLVSLTEEESIGEGGQLVQGHDAEGALLAELRSALPGSLPDPEAGSVFDGPIRSAPRVEMTWDTVTEGEPFPPWHFQITADGNAQYVEQIADPLALYRDYAHPHWLLSTANRVLTREYVMPAWIHVGSELRLREPVRVGDTLTVRAVPLEKWERKGHQFIRLYVAYLRDDVLTTDLYHTAIFRVAE